MIAIVVQWELLVVLSFSEKCAECPCKVLWSGSPGSVPHPAWTCTVSTHKVLQLSVVQGHPAQ